MHRELLLAEIAVRRGQLDAATSFLEIVDDRSRRLQDVQFRGDFHMLRATLALEEGRTVEAFDDIQRALALADASDDNFYTPQMCMLGVQALADRFERSRMVGGSEVDADDLRAVADSLAAQADATVAPSGSGRTGLPQPRACALTCRAEESRLHASDPSRWDSAARAWEDLSQPYEVAYCRWREAEARLKVRGDRGQAVDNLSIAWRIAVKLGADGLRHRIEQLAVRARIELQTAAPDQPSAAVADLRLTARELEVLGYLATGWSDREIADELFISKKTASVHVSNILRKLGASNRIEAGEIGQRVGLR
jgi:ATP/maltotriose-dependent transcriptional regulator MalT